MKAVRAEYLKIEGLFFINLNIQSLGFIFLGICNTRKKGCGKVVLI